MSSIPTHFSDDGDRPETNDTPVPASTETLVMRQAGHDCQSCGHEDGDTRDDGTDVELEIHHQTPRAEGGSNHPENLSVFCRRCHQRIHQFTSSESPCAARGSDLMAIYEGEISPEEEQQAENLMEALALGEYRLGLTATDHQLLIAVHLHGPCSISTIAEEANASGTAVYNRVHRLASAEVLMQHLDTKEWDFAGSVTSPLRGHLPAEPNQASRLLRDQVALEMRDSGHSLEEIAEALDVHRSTARVAVDRAKAFKPPLDALDALGMDPSDMVAD